MAAENACGDICLTLSMEAVAVSVITLDFLVAAICLAFARNLPHGVERAKSRVYKKARLLKDYTVRTDMRLIFPTYQGTDIYL